MAILLLAMEKLGSPRLSPSLKNWLSNWASAQSYKHEEVFLQHLKGDGSTRIFYRVQTPGNTYVLLEEPGLVTSRHYASYQSKLKSKKLPVPDFVEIDPKNGFLLMEDLGDEFVQNKILHNPEEKIFWLKKSISLLAEFHGKMYPNEIKEARELAFSGKKFFEEFQFTEEHLLEKFLNLKKWDSQTQKSVQHYCENIAALKPTVLCHRDYHTRNLMITNQEIRLIDFQDSREGPLQYDLASLLYDAYLPLKEAEREKLIGHYVETLSAFPLRKEVKLDTLSKEIQQIAYQRVLKAAGSFASFYTRFKKETHLKYIRPALDMALAIETAVPEISESLGNAFQIKNWLLKLKEKKL